MIYEMITVDVIPGKVREFNELWFRESLPIWEKHGIKHIGSWVTVIGKSNEVVRLFEYRDLAHFEQWRKFLSEDDEGKAIYRKVWAYIAHLERKMLGPAL